MSFKDWFNRNRGNSSPTLWDRAFRLPSRLTDHESFYGYYDDCEEDTMNNDSSIRLVLSLVNIDDIEQVKIVKNEELGDIRYCWVDGVKMIDMRDALKILPDDMFLMIMTSEGIEQFEGLDLD